MEWTSVLVQGLGNYANYYQQKTQYDMSNLQMEYRNSLNEIAMDRLKQVMDLTMDSLRLSQDNSKRQRNRLLEDAGEAKMQNQLRAISAVGQSAVHSKNEHGHNLNKQIIKSQSGRQDALITRQLNRAIVDTFVQDQQQLHSAKGSILEQSAGFARQGSYLSFQSGFKPSFANMLLDTAGYAYEMYENSKPSVAGEQGEASMKFSTSNFLFG